MTLARAVSVFAEGFSFVRSLTHPYIVEQRHGLTVMRDAPRRNRVERNPEYIVLGLTVAQAVRALRTAGCVRGGVCVVSGNDADLDAVKAAYKAHGLRLMRHEPFFAASTKSVPKETDGRVRRVRTQAEADAVNKANRRRQILPEHVGRDDTVRLYAAYDRDVPVGWVSSIPTRNGNWVANLYVAPEHRGKGLGAGLMATMLAEDRAHGVEWSVLLASGAGARLYPHVGYGRIGTLQLFVPGPGWRA